MAAAAEELSSSVAEISRQVYQSNEFASKAVADAERTNATVQVLSSGAEKIPDSRLFQVRVHGALALFAADRETTTIYVLHIYRA